MANEALCKVLCHNVCVLIQAHYELGIAATFWGREDTSAPEDIAGEPLAPDEIEAWAWA